MKKFVTIVDNKIVSERYGNEIVDGEALSSDNLLAANVGDVLIDGVWQKDPNDIAEAEKQTRISALKETIANKKLLDMDCIQEQLELKQLLGL